MWGEGESVKGGKKGQKAGIGERGGQGKGRGWMHQCRGMGKGRGCFKKNL